MGMVSGVLVFKGSQIWAAQSIRFQQFFKGSKKWAARSIRFQQKRSKLLAARSIRFQQERSKLWAAWSIRFQQERSNIWAALFIRFQQSFRFRFRFFILFAVVLTFFFLGHSGMTIPKDAGGLGGLGERVFGPKI